jgi:hypothetical protein
MEITEKLSLETPNRSKSRWIKTILGLAEWEMMGALGGISSKTLGNWLGDFEDKVAKNSPEFQFLLDIPRAARGVIRPEFLAEWLHDPSEELGGIAPVELLMRSDTRNRVLALLHDLKHGNLA